MTSVDQGRLGLGIVGLVVGCVVAFKVAVSAWGPILGDNAGIMCVTETRNVPAGLPLDVAFSGRITWWPVGVECSYFGPAGTPVVVAESDWGGTVAMVAAGVIVAVSLALIVSSFLSRPAPHRP